MSGSTLLYASCLEAVGLRPFVVLQQEHAFLAVWQSQTYYPQMVCEDSEFLLKGVGNGVHDIVLVETTLICHKAPIPFEDAVARACETLQDGTFQLAVDVYSCRLHGIKPLPLLKEELDELESTVEHRHGTEDVLHIAVGEAVEHRDRDITKQDIWERKLLDLTKCNSLLNLRLGMRALPLISMRIDALEDVMQLSDALEVVGLPSMLSGCFNATEILDTRAHRDLFEPIFRQSLEQGSLVSYLSEEQVEYRLKELWRSSRLSLEESGTATLFLALGLLKWTEVVGGKESFYAPIILLPVEIVYSRRSYKLRIRRDTDPMPNITLLEYLRRIHGLELEGLDPLPTDDNGVDVSRVLASVRAQIRTISGWDVLEEALIGNFSFTKFVMWHDIHTHADHLAKHPILRSLMNLPPLAGDASTKPESIEIDLAWTDRHTRPSDYAVPISADSSQLEAIIASGEGKSFVLHGPPGTGKSQTITNMIANALFHGKRVLFVAEKRAALEVVQSRLEQIGLAPFCLELHSNKVTKTHVLSQLDAALSVTHPSADKAWAEDGERLFDLRGQLLSYFDALHEEREQGLSLYTMIESALRYRGRELDVERLLSSGLKVGDFSALEEQVRDLRTIFALCGHPCGHPLGGLEVVSSGALGPRMLRTKMQLLSEQALLLRGLLGQFASLLGHTPRDSRETLSALQGLLSSLSSLGSFSPRLYDIVELPEQGDKLRELLSEIEVYEESRLSLVETYGAGLIEADASVLLAEWQAVRGKWALSRYFATRSALAKLKVLSPALSTAEVVEEVLPLVVEHQALGRELYRSLSEYSLPERNGRDMLSYVGAIGEELKLLQPLPRAIRELAGQEQIPYMALKQTLCQRLEGWYMERESYRKPIESYLEAYRVLEATVADLWTYCSWQCDSEHYLEQLHEHAHRYMPHLSQLRDWRQWTLRRGRLLASGAHSVVELLEEQEVTAEEAANSLMRSLYAAMSKMVIDRDERLSMFSGLLFEDVIAKYRELSDSFAVLTQRELSRRLAERVPLPTITVSSTSELGILKKNIANGGRGMSIRKRIDKIPTLIHCLCPCMLMSPLSVAQYIDMESEPFDLVIFDEASQMPTSEAVGAIARGRSLVVVGDPKQMPPTSFFAINQPIEEESTLEDMESILDDCIAISLPSRYLTWHYRSKHESLIAFRTTTIMMEGCRLPPRRMHGAVKSLLSPL